MDTGNTKIYTTGFSRSVSISANVRWVLIGEAPSRCGMRYVLCRCECGTEREVQLQAIKNGNSRACKSCGIATHGETSVIKHGKRTREYVAWRHMRTRCGNLKCADYPDYGGRGIKVCERWLHSFENFLADMGRKPSPRHSIDRIDVNGNYEPGNVRWSTETQQARNKRNSKLNAEKVAEIRALAETGITRRELAKRYGVNGSMISKICLNQSWVESRTSDSG